MTPSSAPSRATRMPRRLRKLLGGGIALLGAGVLASDFWHACLGHTIVLTALHALKIWLAVVATALA